MFADPLHLSPHQRTPSPPPLSSSGTSHRGARLKTSNPCNHRNQQYSIIGLTNAAGTLVERYSYTAYGTLGIYDASGTVRTTSTYANRYTYTGREYDPDLNLYHFRARWYDPSTGGFISRDPLGYVDGMSLYRGYFADSSSLDWSGSTSTTTGSGWVWHHLVPWELFPEARRVAYHINDPCNGWGLPQDLHKELHDLGWNDDWIAWYEGFREKGKWPTQQDFIDQVNRMKSAPKYRSIIERGVQATFEYPGTYTRKCRGDYLVPGCNGKPKLGPGAYGAGIIFMSPFFSQVVDAADVVQKACGPVMVVCGMCDAELDALEEAMKRFYSPGGMSQFNCQAIIYAYEVMANCAGLPTLGAEYTAAFGKCSEIVTVDRASQPYYVAPPVPLIDGPPGVVSRSIDD
ncbi:MAG: RHS repeat-associated core domain-containing protein [Planctomycetaceae bacterium]|nr:RHS repeat-associated core domain-containing protein [Planctomycetaceae bacterium]